MAWRRALAAELPDLEFRVAPDIGDPADVRYVLAWKPPTGFFAPFRNLALVVNLGLGRRRAGWPRRPAGGAHLAPLRSRHGPADDELRAVRRHPPRPRHPRLRARAAPRRMALHPPAPARRASGSACWASASSAGPLPPRWRASGFDVSGWARTPKTIPGVRCAAGREALDDFLAESDILVVMLPLTPQTRGLLDARRLALLPRGASLVNVSRGAIIDEPALIAALRAGAIARSDARRVHGRAAAGGPSALGHGQGADHAASGQHHGARGRRPGRGREHPPRALRWRAAPPHRPAAGLLSPARTGRRRQKPRTRSSRRRRRPDAADSPSGAGTGCGSAAAAG